VGDRDWPDRLVIALEQALVTGMLTRSAYTREADVSSASATNDLRRLLDAGWIEQEGHGPSRYYRPSAALRALVVERAGER